MSYYNQAVARERLVNRKCRSGGIGRRAGFRCLWSQDRVGSSPISCVFFYIGKPLVQLGFPKISRHEKYGWTITEPTEQLLDFCISNQLEDIQIVRQTLLSPIRVPGNHPTVISPRKPSSTRKYICPCCHNSFRATKNINVLCLDCHTPFIQAV